jgi:hypothetical protein
VAIKKATLEKVNARHKAMYDLWKSGKSLRKIGKLYRVTCIAVLYHIVQWQKIIGER